MNLNTISPHIQSVVNAMEESLKHAFDDRVVQDGSNPERWLREHRTLRFQLPRGWGNSTVAHSFGSNIWPISEISVMDVSHLGLRLSQPLNLDMLADIATKKRACFVFDAASVLKSSVTNHIYRQLTKNEYFMSRKHHAVVFIG